MEFPGPQDISGRKQRSKVKIEGKTSKVNISRKESSSQAILVGIIGDNPSREMIIVGIIGESSSQMILVGIMAILVGDPSRRSSQAILVGIMLVGRLGAVPVRARLDAVLKKQTVIIAITIITIIIITIILTVPRSPSQPACAGPAQVTKLT